MNKNKYCIVYRTKLYSITEAIEILKKCPPDIFFKLYHKYRKELATTMNNRKKGKLTLADKIDNLSNDLNHKIENLSNDLNRKIDNLGNDLRNEMNAGFKQVNARIDGIDARLDYIVKANNLKDNK